MAEIRPPLRFVGRQGERRRLTTLLDDARSSRSGVVVIRGEPGIGKTTLLDTVILDARDSRVLRTCGSETTLELPYVGLQQLLQSLGSDINRLPEPQQFALQAALGGADGASDRLLVGLGVLTLLSLASEHQPLVCVVDDAQWMDAPSIQALAFVARRVKAEPIAMLFATRDAIVDDRYLHDQPSITLPGLNHADSRLLLNSVLPGRADDPVRTTLLAEAAGNPLALVELHTLFTTPVLEGGYGLAPSTSTTARLERIYVHKLNDLPERSRRLLLVAAAETVGRSDWVWAAAAGLDIGRDAITAAADAGLVTTDGHDFQFRHPLIRSTLYESASERDRRNAHGALSAAITEPTAVQFRTWHRAHATEGSDEELALELEHCAREARERGGAVVSAAFLTLSAKLSGDPARRAIRSVTAAEENLSAGQPDAALALLGIAESASDDSYLTARAELVRAQAAFVNHRGADAPALFLSAARRLAHLDPKLSRESYLQALTAAIVVGHCATDETSTPLAVAEAAAAAPVPTGPHRAVDLILDGLVIRLTRGHQAAVSTLKSGVAQYVRDINSGTADPRWHDITHRVCLDVFDMDTYDRLVEHQLHELRSTGTLSVLPLALQTYAGVCVNRCDLRAAELLLDQSSAITSVTGTSLPGCMWAYLAAYGGDEQRCLQIVDDAVAQALRRGEGFDANATMYSKAILHIGLRQFAEAADAAHAALSHTDIGMRGHVLNELVEAATYSGDLVQARAAADEIGDEASRCETNAARGFSARASALVAADDVAEAGYQEAIAYLEATPFGIYVPRTQLVYGEWLQRMGRNNDARVPLRSAYDVFVKMGATAFAHRARVALHGVGETVDSNRANNTVRLTPQEHRIAVLAQHGSTNTDIGSRLFLSPRTVEWHLTRIFGKLGIRSRRELRNVHLDA